MEEDVNMGAAIIPNLDSIAEFRILTNNFDAEYGEFSGGQINVVTNPAPTHFTATFLNSSAIPISMRAIIFPRARRFQPEPIRRNVRRSDPKEQDIFLRRLSGNALDPGRGYREDSRSLPAGPDRQSLRTGKLLCDHRRKWEHGAHHRQRTLFGRPLSQKLGYAVSAGEPYYTQGCTSATCVFPGAIIPQSAWSAPATNLLKYIPAPSNANGTFSTSAYNQTLRDDKGGYRADANTR